MKHLLRFLGIFLFLHAFSLQAGEKFPAEFDPPPAKRFIAADNLGYGPPEPAIKKLLIVEKKIKNSTIFA